MVVGTGSDAPSVTTAGEFNVGNANGNVVTCK